MVDYLEVEPVRKVSITRLVFQNIKQKIAISIGDKKTTVYPPTPAECLLSTFCQPGIYRHRQWSLDENARTHYCGNYHSCSSWNDRKNRVLWKEGLKN